MKETPEYTQVEVRDFMYGQLKLLMDAASDHIHEKDEESKKYYDSRTHHYLDKNGWELLFPLEKERWPDNFLEHNYMDIDQKIWPQFTTYSYMMDVIAPPLIPSILLNFGYAVVEGKLIRCTFFVLQTMVDYQVMPQGMVIDPLAEYHGIKPSFYIGCAIYDKKYIENWMIYKKNPLEMFVNEKNAEEHKERIRNSYMEAYNNQMMYEPEWFPEKLIKFAQEEGLSIPSGQKGDGKNMHFD